MTEYREQQRRQLQQRLQQTRRELDDLEQALTRLEQTTEPNPAAIHTHEPITQLPIAAG